MAKKFLIPKISDLEKLPIKERWFWKGFHKCRTSGGRNRRVTKLELGNVPKVGDIDRLPLKERLFWRGFYFGSLGGQNRRSGKIPLIKVRAFYTGIDGMAFYDLYPNASGTTVQRLWREYASVCPPGEDDVFRRPRRRKV